MTTRAIKAALAIITSASCMPLGVAMADGISGPTITGTRLDISARGTVKRIPNLAIITAGVVTQTIDARSAMTTNAAAMSKVIADLRRAGIADTDLATAQISLSPQYRYADNRPPVITGYQASNTVTVKFRDISRAGPILDALVAAGANQINGPIMTLDKPEAALDEARADAIRTARVRADLYAKATGLSVKRIVMISESFDGGAPAPMMMSRAMAGDAMAKTEIMPGEQDIGVVVNITYELGS